MRVWRKGNSLTLLVGIQASTDTVETSVEIPLKKKKRTKTMTQPMPLLNIYPEETKIGKDACTPLFIAALFT